MGFSTVLAALFIVWAGVAGGAQAQSVVTASPTSTPDCCQQAQTVTGQGGAGGDFNTAGPMAIYQDTLFVADVLNNRVQEFHLSGGAPAAMSPAGILPVTFNEPYGEAVAGHDLYVGDFTDGKIFRVDLSDNAAVTAATAAGQILGMAADPASGEIYASLWNVGVQVLTSAGESQTILSNGIGGAPRGLWKSGNRLYVADSSNNQIVAFDETGNVFSGPLTVITAVNAPYKAAIDGNGGVYVASGGNDELDEFDSGYNRLRACPLGFPVPGLTVDGLTVDGLGNVYVSGGAAGAWEVVEIKSCSAGSLPTPTPYYGGSNPPAPADCFIYPSPARGDHATLSYNMAESGSVDLKILDENGELAAEITDRKPAGVQVTPVSLSHLAPGVYFYVVTLHYDSGRSETIKVHKFAVIR